MTVFITKPSCGWRKGTNVSAEEWGWVTAVDRLNEPLQTSLPPAPDTLMGKSRNRRTFSKTENLRFLQNYDDYNCIFGIKLKGLHYLSFEGSCSEIVLTIKCSKKNMNFAKNVFLKFENILNFDTYFHLLRNIVLKLFDDKCKAKACEILTQSY